MVPTPADGTMSALPLHGLSRTKLRLVLGAAVTFVVLTLVEVVLQREDWPLSCYPMYSRPGRSIAERTVINGVSSVGEFRLTPEHTDPYSGARLIRTTRKVLRDPAKARAFARIIGERYEERREREGWPALQGIRIYTETWKPRLRLAGIDQPSRTLAAALYVPPPALLARLRAEVAETAPPLKAVPLPRTDQLFELEARDCAGSCIEATDRYAAGGTALSLSGDGTHGRVTLRATLDHGQYAVFVRMKRAAKKKGDRLSFKVDGKPVDDKQGLGNYGSSLAASWVWASAKPGWPALILELEKTGEHVLELSATEQVLVDQLWLSPVSRELPVDNAARVR